MINQYTGTAQGNPNYVYYRLAAASFGKTGNGACNSSLGNGVSSACIFYDVTTGDIDSPCSPGSPNCYAPTGTIGVLSTSTSFYVPAYPAGTGWDFATGLGSINAYNLVTAWNSAVPSFTLTVGSTAGGSVTSSVGGISCGSSCSASLSQGKQVTLIATPAPGWSFVAWTGGCGGRGNCTLALFGDTVVIPLFHQTLHPVLH